MIKRQYYSKKKLLIILILFCVPFGCASPSIDRGERGPFNLSDEELLPFAAMFEIDRDAFCLTEIALDSQVKIDTDPLRDGGDAATLRIYNDRVSRIVAFEWEDDRYVWIGEQETHYSGRTFVTPDGELPEHITVTYHDKEYGIDSKQTGLAILYIGENQNIPMRLTCEQASSLLQVWWNQ